MEEAIKNIKKPLPSTEAQIEIELPENDEELLALVEKELEREVAETQKVATELRRRRDSFFSKLFGVIAV